MGVLGDHEGIDADHDELVEMVLAENRSLGRHVGTSYAEGFRPYRETAVQYIERERSAI